MKKITQSYELTINDANQSMVGIVAVELGWYPESVMTPEQTIQSFFQKRDDDLRLKVLNAAKRYFGEAGAAQMNEVMAAYDGSAISKITIE